MYVYQSHMGGLYTTAEAQDWEDLYCEECGDSDLELGCFDDDDAEGVWNLIKPYNLACIGCKRREPDDSCEFHCKDIGEWSTENLDLLHAMQFIAENVEIHNPEYVYLICEDADSGYIYANFKPIGYKFGEGNTIPCSFCLKEELREKVALSLVPWNEEMVKDPYLVAIRHGNGKTCVVYMCVVKREEGSDLNAASRVGDGWYGWCNPEEYKPVNGENWVQSILAEHVVETQSEK